MQAKVRYLEKRAVVSAVAGTKKLGSEEATMDADAIELL